MNSLNRLLDGRRKAASSCIDPRRPRLLVTRSSGFPGDLDNGVKGRGNVVVSTTGRGVWGLRRIRPRAGLVL
jgi:hypothetical protein